MLISTIPITDINNSFSLQRCDGTIEADTGTAVASQVTGHVVVNDGLDQEVFPNLSVALQITLTVPVTVASAERSFSKLKLIKTYLRSTMTQDRLVGLATISVESDVARSVDYSSLLQTFAAKKARKVSF